MKKLICLCGPPNCGKSSIATKLMQDKPESVYSISPGLWLRYQLSLTNNDCETPECDLPNFISNNFCNDALEQIVEQHIEEQLKLPAVQEKHVLIEGYPRTPTEAEHIVNMARRNRTLARQVCVIVLDLDQNSMKERAAKRKRSDDNENSLTHRHEFWLKNQENILKPCNELVTRYNSSEMSIEALCQKIITHHLEPEQLPTPSPCDHANGYADPPLSAPCSFWSSATAMETATLVQMQLRLSKCPRRKRQFCGSHPVSLERQHMGRLLRYPYLCSLKIDGLRFFCLIRDGTLWFLNRKLQVWRGPSDERLRAFDDSLLDGELALDNLFVVIDVVAVNSQNVMHRPIIERLAHAAGIGQLLMYAPFHFRAQEYVDRTQAALLIERATQMPFRSDGLILQPAKLPMRLGIDYNLFKFKEPEQNTVDLLYGEDGYLYCRKTSDSTLDDETMTLDTNSGILLTRVRGALFNNVVPSWLKPGVVAEFSPTPPHTTEAADDANAAASPQWIPRKPRWDKHFPNMDWVVENILTCIADNITSGELVQYLQSPPVSRNQVPSPPLPIRGRRQQQSQSTQSQSTQSQSTQKK